MPLPPLSPLQFAVIGEVIPGEISGRDLRARLHDRHGIKRSAPAFYELMSRLAEMGLVQGEYHPKKVGDQHVRERRYTLLGPGRDAWNETRAFYLDGPHFVGAAVEGAC